MSPPSRHTPATRLLAVGFVLLTAAFLLWLWRRTASPYHSHSQANSTAAPKFDLTATATTRSATPPGSSAISLPVLAPLPLHPLLAALERALAAGDARPREAVLSFKDDAALQRFLERAARSDLHLVGRSDRLRAVRVRFDDFADLQRELDRHADDYAAISANTLVGIPQPPPREARADLDQIPFRNTTLDYLGATGDRSTWGRGVTIAVLDTGVASDPTFDAGRLRTLDLGHGSTPGRGPDDGHGTSVAALAAGSSPDAPGLAPAANLLSIRVTDTSGLSDLFTISEAIVAATDAGARIINVSLGGYASTPVLEAAIAYARSRDAVIVAAAGNDQAAQLAWPAADPRTISVGAIDRASQQVAFSNSGASLQLTAPGYGVQTAWLDGQRAYVDGTSVSAPLVSGAIAAVMSQNPHLTAAQAAAILVETASDAGAPGPDAAYGRGILNLGWALNRNNPAYIDTAISSHFYDAATNQMQFVLQNRSGRSVTGLKLEIAAGTQTTAQTIPTLAPGATHVATVPVSTTALRTHGTLPFTTELQNPPNLPDQLPTNNRKSSTLTAPKK